MIPQQLATCPHCGKQQKEPEGSISTYCRSCGQHFSVSGTPKKKLVRLPKSTRTITCFQCGTEARVVPSALSTQCQYCSTYLNLRDYRIAGASNEKIDTYGEAEFQTGCFYRNAEVKADRIRVRGKVESRLVANQGIEVEDGGDSKGRARAPEIRIGRKGKLKSNSLETERLVVEGFLEADEIRVTQWIKVENGGVLRARKIFANEVEVDPNGIFQGELITPLPASE